MNGAVVAEMRFPWNCHPRNSGSAQSSARAVFVDTGAEWSKSHIMIFIGAIILGIIVHSGAFNPSKTAVPAASFIIP